MQFCKLPIGLYRSQRGFKSDRQQFIKGGMGIVIRRGMPGSLIGVALALLLLLPAATDASELLDVLRKKGVISQKEYDELKAAESKRAAQVKEALEKRAEGNFKIRYKPGGGFRITSKDKQHQLRFGVQLFNQVYIPIDDEVDKHSAFRLRRARFTMRGHIFKHWTYKFELNGVEKRVLDQDAYFGWEQHKQFKLRVGQHKTRFGGEQTWSRSKLFFLERSIINDNMTEGVSRGVYAYGSLHPMFGYELSLTKGNGVGSTAGDNNGNDNNDLDVSGRFIWKPTKGSTMEKMWPIQLVGAFSMGEQEHNSRGARTRLFLRDNRLQVFNAATGGLRQRYGGELWYNKDYKTKGALPLSILAEYMHERQERKGVSGDLDDVIRQGWHVQGGYMLSGSRKKNGLELVGRVESFEGDDGAGGEQEVNVYGLGVSYWPIAETRFSLNVFRFDIDQPEDPASPDPFKSGDVAWAVLAGAYFKF